MERAIRPAILRRQRSPDLGLYAQEPIQSGADGAEQGRAAEGPGCATGNSSASAAPALIDDLVPRDRRIRDGINRP